MALLGACASTTPSPPKPIAEERQQALPAEKRGEPVAHEEPAPAPKRPGAFANLDPDDDFVVGPPDAFPDCDDELTKAGVKFAKATLPVHTEGKKVKITCGAPQVVTYLRGPEKIAYDPPPLLTCTMALALAWWEKLVAAEAQRTLHAKVTRIEQLGTYSCREVAAYPGTVSEHSYANAIDIRALVLDSGRRLTVEKDFGALEAPARTRAAELWRSLARRAYDERLFSTVLTPYWDSLHRDHFHLDLARYRVDGTRPDPTN